MLAEQYGKNIVDCREVISMIETNVKLTLEQKLYFIYNWLLHCTNLVSSFTRAQENYSHHRRKQRKSITVPIHVWFRQLPTWKRGHTNWAVMLSTAEWSNMRKFALKFWQNQFLNMLLVSEPLKEWTGYWQHNYIYTTTLCGLNLAKLI